MSERPQFGDRDTILLRLFGLSMLIAQGAFVGVVLGIIRV